MDNSQFKTVVTAKHSLFDLHLKETFEYRDLIFLFVKRDFVAKYKQTILGPAWAIIQPLLSTVVFTIVFGSLAKLTNLDVPGDYAIPGFLFYMTGNVCWSYFSQVLTETSNTFIENSATMGKVYYPRLVTPIATACSNLIAFAIQFVMLIILWLIFIIIGGTSIRVTPWLLMIPLCILQLIVTSVGTGIIISSMTTKYRDLRLLVTFCVELWKYACPIAYGLCLIPSKWIGLYMLNPVSPVITTFRYALFGFGYFNLASYLIGWVISILLFTVGILMFSKVEKNFMDTI